MLGINSRIYQLSRASPLRTANVANVNRPTLRNDQLLPNREPMNFANRPTSLTYQTREPRTNLPRELAIVANKVCEVDGFAMLVGSRG